MTSQQLDQSSRAEDSHWHILTSRASNVGERQRSEMRIMELSHFSTQRAMSDVYSHVLMGAVYRLLAIGSPVALYLIAGHRVVATDLSRYYFVALSCCILFILTMSL
jgi:hypothetical protein